MNINAMIRFVCDEFSLESKQELFRRSEYGTSESSFPLSPELKYVFCQSFMMPTFFVVASRKVDEAVHFPHWTYSR